MKELIQALNNVKAQANAQMPFARKEINRIIKTKSRDNKEIEQLLDILLDYQFVGIGAKEFNTLNKYYGTFDEEASSDWKRIQKDLLESE